MDLMCQNSLCKIKGREYKNEIYALEDDIKDKDEFAQKVVRQRNAYKAEISILKKELSDLTRENEELIEKNKQLDEDANDGAEMLKNALERERKLVEELKEVKTNILMLKKTEKDNDEVKAKFTFVKKRLEVSLKEKVDTALTYLPSKSC